ncbi:MAG: hypothetical protein ACI8R4_004195, partial [Paracoccaceae bacterium]
RGVAKPAAHRDVLRASPKRAGRPCQKRRQSIFLVRSYRGQPVGSRPSGQGPGGPASGDGRFCLRVTCQRRHQKVDKGAHLWLGVAARAKHRILILSIGRQRGHDIHDTACAHGIVTQKPRLIGNSQPGGCGLQQGLPVIDAEPAIGRDPKGRAAGVCQLPLVLPGAV